MWGWAADRDHIPMNFLAGIKRNEKDRVLTADEMRSFLAALVDPDIETTEIVAMASRASC